MVLLRSSCPRPAGVSSARLVPAAVLLAALLPMTALAAPLQVSRVAAGLNCVALTFDDGPDPALTPRLLAVLEQKHAPATFFVLGARAAAAPDIVSRARQDGNEIGNHSWDHAYLTQISLDDARRELTRTDDILASITGEKPKVSRAPYGKLTEAAANAAGPRTFIGWTVDTRDWEFPDVDRIIASAVNEATDGSIVLLHDIHPKSVEAVPAIIDGLRARGFRLATVSNLLAGNCGDDGGAWGGIFAAWTAPSAPPVRPATATLATAPLPTRPAAAQPALRTDEPLFPMLGRLFGGSPRAP
jgi:peptidoglycan/xylan/chitin deacetylase (PgdA/CDA1 family)